MSDKYIIRNCPMYFHGNCYGHTGSCDCQNCTDCVMKQIIQVCNEYSNKWDDCDFSNGLSDEIFKLLDIQDVG